MLDTRNYPCPQYGEGMKLTSGLTRHLNACMSLLLCIQLNRNTLMLVEDDNTSDHFMYHEEEEYPLGNNKQEIREIQRDSVGQSSDNESLRDMLSGRIPQAGLLGSESSSSLREVRFKDQEFTTGTPISNIKYNHPGFQNNNPYYPIHNQLDHELAKYFAEPKTTKSNIDQFLSDPLMTPLTEKLSYQNADK